MGPPHQLVTPSSEVMPTSLPSNYSHAESSDSNAQRQYMLTSPYLQSVSQSSMSGVASVPVDSPQFGNHRTPLADSFSHYLQFPRPAHHADIELPSVGTEAHWAYSGRRGPPMAVGSFTSSSTSSTSIPGGLYRRLTPVLTPFGKDKKSGYSQIERYIHRYNRRLTSSSRRTLCTVLTGSIVSLFFLARSLISDFAHLVIICSLLAAAAAIIFSFWLLAWILRFDEGTAEMREVAGPIHEGSEGFFLVQYGTISKISFIFAGLIFIVYIFRDPSSSAISTLEVSSFGLALITSLTFMFGALCSALSGYSGMWVSVRTNVRVASAARRCYNDALQLCFRGGAFSSILNVALAVGGISLTVLLLLFLYPGVPFVQMPLLLVGYGFGASLVAMFAQLGGGIYTKAADVGADLVGKIEAGRRVR